MSDARVERFAGLPARVGGRERQFPGGEESIVLLPRPERHAERGVPRAAMAADRRQLVQALRGGHALRNRGGGHPAEEHEVGTFSRDAAGRDLRNRVLTSSYVTSLAKVVPSLYLAVADAKAKKILPKGIEFSFTEYDDQCKADEGQISAVEAYASNRPHVIFGPTCEYSVGKSVKPRCNFKGENCNYSKRNANKKYK